MSAPYWSTSSSGLTTLPRCLLILRPSAITISWKRQPANGSPVRHEGEGADVAQRLGDDPLVEDEAAAVAAGDQPLGRQPLAQVGVGEHLLGAVLGRDRGRDPEPERVEVAVERVGLALGGARRSAGSRRRRSRGARPAGSPRRSARGRAAGRPAGRPRGPAPARSSSQWTIGIGVPQERWREIEKSLAR